MLVLVIVHFYMTVFVALEESPAGTGRQDKMLRAVYVFSNTYRSSLRVGITSTFKRCYGTLSNYKICYNHRSVVYILSVCQCHVYIPILADKLEALMEVIQIELRYSTP